MDNTRGIERSVCCFDDKTGHFPAGVFMIGGTTIRVSNWLDAFGN